MNAILLSLLLPGCCLDHVEATEVGLSIVAYPAQLKQACPQCACPSSHVHSYYQRCIDDLPMGNQPVRLWLRMRRFRCLNPLCSRRTFSQILPDLLMARARRTVRLARAQRETGLALGGEAGARLLRLLYMPTSPDTVLRLLRRDASRMTSPVRILGIDDWAFRKGLRYGTILVDLQRRQVVDLLPDRKAETVAQWLRNHPLVETVTRDRATEYARAISEALPQARQVADRWHLLHNRVPPGSVRDKGTGQVLA